jgi:hypothetical protein
MMGLKRRYKPRKGSENFPAYQKHLEHKAAFENLEDEEDASMTLKELQVDVAYWIERS